MGTQISKSAIKRLYDGPAEIVIVLDAHPRVPVPELALQHLALSRAYYRLRKNRNTLTPPRLDISTCSIAQVNDKIKL